MLRPGRFIAAILSVGLTFICIWGSAAFAVATTSECLSCHDYSAQSPVHPMLSSKHGDPSLPGSPMATGGCLSCHGESDMHAKAPLKNSPGISFGPHWTGSITNQNQPCLNCHKEDTAAHWQGGTHQKQELTCVTCHDLHTQHDPVISGKMMEVCTTCHKPQKQGIHQLSGKLADNPECTLCHNPHADSAPTAQLIANRSAGCRACHDLTTMASDASVSDKAKSYHRTMTQLDKSCIDCHKGIAHAPADSVLPVLDLPGNSRSIGLFYPGQHDYEWLLNEHEGSQSLRQGRQCLQCHAGEELKLAATTSAKSIPAYRALDVRMEVDQKQLVTTFSWQGSKKDQSLAVMWNDGGNQDFARVGCWAACHDDMPGMDRDRGQATSKYLPISRAQMQRIGVPPQVKSEAELKQLMAADQFVTVQRINLDKGDQPSLETAKLLAKLDWQKADASNVSSVYKNGRWTVTLRRPVPPHAERQREFGIALHGANGKGAGHWVSLPLTYAIEGGEVNFVVH